jgi:hypothetical protein
MILSLKYFSFLFSLSKKPLIFALPFGKELNEVLE